MEAESFASDISGDNLERKDENTDAENKPCQNL